MVHSMALSKKELAGMMSTGDGEWRTPRARFDEWDKIFHFAVDVGASSKNTLCSYYIGREENALDPKTHWCKAGGPAYCNPPYGKYIINWVAKAVSEARHSKRAIVMLLPARTETEWFQHFVFENAQLVCFLNTRVPFDTPKLKGKKSQPAFPSVLAVYLGQYWDPLFGWKTELQKFGYTVKLV